MQLDPRGYASQKDRDRTDGAREVHREREDREHVVRQQPRANGAAHEISPHEPVPDQAQS